MNNIIKFNQNNIGLKGVKFNGSVVANCLGIKLNGKIVVSFQEQPSLVYKYPVPDPTPIYLNESVSSPTNYALMYFLDNNIPNIIPKNAPGYDGTMDGVKEDSRIPFCKISGMFKGFLNCLQKYCYDYAIGTSNTIGEVIDSIDMSQDKTNPFFYPVSINNLQTYKINNAEPKNYISKSAELVKNINNEELFLLYLDSDVYKEYNTESGVVFGNYDVSSTGSENFPKLTAENGFESYYNDVLLNNNKIKGVAIFTGDRGVYGKKDGDSNVGFIGADVIKTAYCAAYCCVINKITDVDDNGDISISIIMSGDKRDVLLISQVNAILRGISDVYNVTEYKFHIYIYIGEIVNFDSSKFPKSKIIFSNTNAIFNSVAFYNETYEYKGMKLSVVPTLFKYNYNHVPKDSVKIEWVSIGEGPNNVVEYFTLPQENTKEFLKIVEEIILNEGNNSNSNYAGKYSGLLMNDVNYLHISSEDYPGFDITKFIDTLQISNATNNYDNQYGYYLNSDTSYYISQGGETIQNSLLFEQSVTDSSEKIPGIIILNNSKFTIDFIDNLSDLYE